MVQFNDKSAHLLTKENDNPLLVRKRSWISSRQIIVLMLVNIAVFTSSLYFFFSTCSPISHELNHELKSVSSYSPVLDHTEIPLVETHIDGEFFPGPNQLLGRLEPGPTTDELWDDFELQRKFVLTREQVVAMGKDPAVTSRFPQEHFGLGDDAYMGALDIFHVLHCFNEIRKEAFKDYFWDGEKTGDHHYRQSRQQYQHQQQRQKKKKTNRHGEVFWLHLRHCTDIVTQNLMCHADASMFPFVWMETQRLPFPDMSVEKKCVDFETLKRWRNEHGIVVDDMKLIRKPKDVKTEMKMHETYWRIFGNETTMGDNTHHVHEHHH